MGSKPTEHAAGDHRKYRVNRQGSAELGDEFVVVVHDLSDDEAQALSQAGIIVDKIRMALDEPYRLRIVQSGQEQLIEHRCPASIGVTIFDGSGNDETSLIHQADQAMYRAKHAGKQGVGPHVPETVIDAIPEPIKNVMNAMVDGTSEGATAAGERSAAG